MTTDPVAADPVAADPVTALVDVAVPSVDRAWTAEAVRRIRADQTRSADTHLVKLAMPPGWQVDLYVKDESTHPTGSLKHRLARSLFLHALCSGWIGPDTTVIEASSGSTAVSEAYFAQMIGVRFVAVMARSTSAAKIALIEREGGVCHLVDDPSTVYDVARQLAECSGGFYLDQFTFAERATDWRGNNNIAESIFDQMAAEPHPVPSWVVVGAGTGGTSATIGRFTRYRGVDTRVCVVDPERSVFLPSYSGRPAPTELGSRIEGIGRPRVEPSFLPSVVDRMLGVPDAASAAAMGFLAERLGRRMGPSTGTSFYGALRLACEMRAQDRAGSIVLLGCDPVDRYRDSFGDQEWLIAHDLDPRPYRALVEQAWESGQWPG